MCSILYKYRKLLSHLLLSIRQNQVGRATTFRSIHLDVKSAWSTDCRKYTVDRATLNGTRPGQDRVSFTNSSCCPSNLLRYYSANSVYIRQLPATWKFWNMSIYIHIFLAAKRAALENNPRTHPDCIYAPQSGTSRTITLQLLETLGCTIWYGLFFRTTSWE